MPSSETTFPFILAKCYNPWLMGRGNPCIQCGACCAFFRVSFFWEEANPEDPESVPYELTESLDGLMQCMKGTNQPHPQCVALSGEIGEKVGCIIYDRRSSVCREFGLHETVQGIKVNGIDLVRCNQARKAWNLPPLTRSELRELSKEPTVRMIRLDHTNTLHKKRRSRF